MKPRCLQVSVTYPSRSGAERSCRRAVELGLAACGQVFGPLKSVFRWKSRIETAREWLCLFKTVPRRFAALERAVRKSHPYEVPEIVAVPFVNGATAYLAWIVENSERRTTRRIVPAGRRGR